MQQINWNYPTNIWLGKNRINDLGKACQNLNINKPLLVTDSGLGKSKIINDALSKLKNDNISTVLFSDIVGNPTGNNVNDGVRCYKKHKQS